MARIADAEIERLKTDISVERLAVAKGVELKPHGKDLMGRCPFHEDRTPSLVITPSMNLWHCLGACQMGGTVIDWVMKAEGVSFRYAVELLRNDSPSLAAGFPTKYQGKRKGAVSARSTMQKMEPIATPSTEDDVLMRRVVAYYHATLKQSPDALGYLERRGLKSAELIERFQLGFADRSLSYRLPPKQRQDGVELRGRLQALGILRESGHEHMRGSLVVPVIDEAGRVTEMYGRKIGKELRDGTPVHMYLPGPHRGVWNVEALASSRDVILCEALIDAMTFWCAGFRNVTASYGVEGFTEDHVAAFRKHGTERVLIAYDRDEAGDRASEKLAERLTAEGLECFRVLFPKGMDANEYARKMTPAPKSLELVLRNAQWMGKGAPKAAPQMTAAMMSSSPLPSPAAPEASEGDGELAVADDDAADVAARNDDAPTDVEAAEAPAVTNDDAAADVAEANDVAAPSDAPAVIDASEAAIVVVGETTTLLADEDGVVLAEIPTTTTPAAPSASPSAARARAADILGIASDTEPEAHPPLAALSSGGAAPRATSPSEGAREAVRPAATRAADVAVTDEEVTLRLGDRRWRVRGLGKNTRLDAMKVNVLVTREGAGFHVDSLELYSARQREAYVKTAAVELAVEERVIKKDLGEVLLKLEELHEQKLAAPKEEAKGPKLTDEEQAAALELLRDPQLLERILADFERCGVVGERTNKLVGYLAATSRKLDQPLAVVIQSSSAAGKSSLMDAVLNLMPEEECSQYSAMTGQSLFYLGETDIRHKILAIVEEEGAERASYALKLLQSEGELTIASTGKDPATGRLVTQEYRVEGPVMIFLTTTAIEVDEELLNRCIVLSVDEAREQTRAIHARQRSAQTIEGMLARRERESVVKLHRDAQRMLRPLLVANPYAEELTFLDHATRTRRDHMKYLTLIRTIALLHQYQRPTKTVQQGGEVLRYIEVTREDIAMANQLCHEVLGRSLDELPPQTRRLLGLVEELVRAGCAKLGVDREDFRFTRRDVRDWTKWGNTQLKIHLGRLMEMEYLLVHRGKQGQGFVYELAYDGRGNDGSPFLSGLLNVDESGGAPAASTSTTSTSRGSEATSRGSEGHFAGVGRPPVGPWSGGGRGAENVTNPHETRSIVTPSAESAEKTHHGRGHLNGASYVREGGVVHVAAAARGGS
jgi:DNA primase catalytic core